MKAPGAASDSSWTTIILLLLHTLDTELLNGRNWHDNTIATTICTTMYEYKSF